MRNRTLIICLITGPAGVGKSTVAKALAKKFERSAVIDADSLRNMIKEGRVKPWPHNEEVEEQMTLAARNVCALANNFLASNFNVIIEDVIGRKLFQQYSEFFSKNQFKVFLLLPRLDS